MRFMAVLNRDGGTLRTMDLEAFCQDAVQIFEAHGHHLECAIVAGDAVQQTLEQAAGTEGVDAIIAGGGDGTVSTAAAVGFRTGRPVAILPAGTMNLFAHALGMPMDLRQALEAIAGGRVSAIDIATANGTPFVHQFSVGIHARLVRIREGMSYGSRIGKMLASLRAIVAAAIDPPDFEAEFQTAKGVVKRRVSAITVSNNPLGDHQIHAVGLKAGVLGVYVAKPMSTTDLMRLALGLFIGDWRNNPMVSEEHVEQVGLRFPRRKAGAQAVMDGELIRLESEVVLQAHPGALAIVLPIKTKASEP